MKTFKWTVPTGEHTDPRSMTRREYRHWSHVRQRGVEWFVVHKGLLFLVAIPTLSALLAGHAPGPEIAVFSWFSGLCAGTAVWWNREARFERARDAGMRTPGDDALDES